MEFFCQYKHLFIIDGNRKKMLIGKDIGVFFSLFQFISLPNKNISKVSHDLLQHTRITRVFLYFSQNFIPVQAIPKN